MSQPAFQMIGDQHATSGAFGTAPFGTAHFGGQDWLPVELPTYHLGSDDLQESHRVKASEVIHYRHNIPVSVRSYGGPVRLWDVNFKAINESALPSLKAFFLARVFNLLPTGSAADITRVHWLGVEFRPAYVSPGVYSLAFSIQEYPQ